ncbi:MAG: TrkH family potassium uptake protein [Acidimicrobiales bacterium]
MSGRDRRISHPGAIVVFGFGITILVGGILLWLPMSHRSGIRVSFLDSLFTSASAVTVTGLAVVDTSLVWSPFGQAVLVGLIQVGGLGVLTMAGFFGISLNRRLGVRSGLLAGAEIGLSDLGVLSNLIRDIVRFVAATEALMALLLAGRFVVEGQGVGRAVWEGVFHSVSAFNNAGFSTFPGGLEDRTGDWMVNLIIAASFIIGGIGFPVVFELRRRWRRPSTWTLHSKVTLAMTANLLVGGTIMFAVLEWRNPETLGGLPIDERILASFFQSATARTAGFNTVSIGGLHTATWMLMILLMMVGASSASTGGGIKTSTFAVVVRSSLAELRGDPTTTMFNRAITPPQQRQALTLVIVSLGTVGTAVFLLSVFQDSLPLAGLLFEASSAFGTVGLSTGVTPALGAIGRVIIILVMFLGRVGPVTFGTAVLLRSQPRQFGYAEEELIVG